MAHHGRVHEVQSPEEYGQALVTATSAGRLLVVDFSAKWCGPCNQIAPVFGEISNRYPTVDFLKVDVDDQPELAAANSITAMPTFLFFNNGQRVDEVKGANAAKIEQTIKKHLASAVAADESDPVKFPPGHVDITEHVDKKQCECLNQNNEHKWDNIFKNDNSFLESDTDEQLLIYIPFSQAVKIHSVVFQAPSDGRAPKVVKLFVNARDMDFQSVDNLPAAHEFNLTADDMKGDKLLPLKFVKFQNVSELTLFVESNIGEEPTSVIQRLRLIGQTQAATNMGDFKRVAGEKGEAHG